MQEITKNEGNSRSFYAQLVALSFGGQRIQQPHLLASARAAYCTSREPGTPLAAEIAIPPNRYETPL
jgi:hypothetical protein